MKVIPKQKPFKPVVLYFEDLENIVNLMGGIKHIKIEKDDDDIYFDSLEELIKECDIDTTDNIKFTEDHSLYSFFSIHPFGISTDFLSNNKNSIENFLRQKESNKLTKSVIHLKYRIPRKKNKKNNTSIIIENPEKKISLVKDILLPIFVTIITALILWYIWGI